MTPFWPVMVCAAKSALTIRLLRGIDHGIEERGHGGARTHAHGDLQGRGRLIGRNAAVAGGEGQEQIARIVLADAPTLGDSQSGALRQAGALARQKRRVGGDDGG